MFQKFCIERYNGFPPQEKLLSAAIAEFLTVKSKESDRPESMLRGIMAALSNYFDMPDKPNPISTETRNLVKALIKTGTMRQAGRSRIMPMAPFTSLFESWGPNESLSISQLRQKSLTLLTIACIARPSDFAPSTGFYRDQIEFNKDGSATLQFFGVKNDADRAGFEVRIEPTSNAYTDPVECLKVYFAKTHMLTPVPEREPVFLSLNPPFKGISSQTVSQILNASIKDAGLPQNVYAAKCFRPSAATAAIVSGCDPNTTRVRGRWKNDKVFFSNYVYPVSDTNVSESILYSNVSL